MSSVRSGDGVGGGAATARRRSTAAASSARAALRGLGAGRRQPARAVAWTSAWRSASDRLARPPGGRRSTGRGRATSAASSPDLVAARQRGRPQVVGELGPEQDRLTGGVDLVRAGAPPAPPTAAPTATGASSRKPDEGQRPAGSAQPPPAGRVVVRRVGARGAASSPSVVVVVAGGRGRRARGGRRRWWSSGRCGRRASSGRRGASVVAVVVGRRGLGGRAWSCPSAPRRRWSSSRRQA